MLQFVGEVALYSVMLTVHLHVISKFSVHVFLCLLLFVGDDAIYYLMFTFMYWLGYDFAVYVSSNNSAFQV